MLRWTGKRRAAFEFASVALVPTGMVLFFLYSYDSQERTEAASTFDARLGGFLLLVVHIFSEAFTSTWQESLFERHRLSIWPMMLWTSFFALLFSAATSAGELADSFEFMRSTPSALPQIVATSIFFALWQFFVLLTIQRYGALAAAAIMSLGQVGSGLTSIVTYHQWLGSVQAARGADPTPRRTYACPHQTLPTRLRQVLAMLLIVLTLVALLRHAWHQRRLALRQADDDKNFPTIEQAMKDLPLGCLPLGCSPPTVPRL